MANLNAEELVRDVRRGLDEVTLSGSQVTMDTNLSDGASANFDASDLLERILDGAAQCVALVHPVHVKDLWVTFNPTNTPDQWPEIMYVIGSEVRFDGKDAQRRTMADHLRKEAEPNTEASSDAYPVFVFEDMEFILAASTTGYSEAGGFTMGDVDAIATGIKQPVIVDGSTRQDPSTADSRYPPSSWEIEMDQRFHAPILQYALSDCFATLGGAGRGDAELLSMLSTDAYQQFQRDLQPYRRTLISNKEESE